MYVGPQISAAANRVTPNGGARNVHLCGCSPGGLWTEVPQRGPEPGGESGDGNPLVGSRPL